MTGSDIQVWSTFLRHRGWFLAALGVALVGSILTSLAIPTTYASRSRIILEADDALYSPVVQQLSGLGLEVDAAADFTSDPFVYDKILHSSSFLQSLMQVPIALPHSHQSVSIADYISRHERRSWWNALFPPTMADLMAAHVKCATDLSTGIITLQAEAQDAQVAKAMVDSATSLLQQTIAAYRSERAEQESQRQQAMLTADSTRYVKAQQALAAFRDAHYGTLSPAAQAQEEDLERESQRLFEAFNKTALQKRQTDILMHKQSPAFTLLEESSVAIDAFAPHWLANFLVWLFYAAIVAMWVVLYRNKYDRKK